jgi:arylsulfatase A-like enzyme
MMKKPLCMLLVFSALTFSCRSEKAQLPNIVLIVADDLGWRDVGFMGSGFYETPGLDKLASEGMVFKQAYAAAANCAPSRACLMTGMYATKHGIYTVGSSERGDARTRRLVPAQNTTTLADDYFTLAEALNQAGYVCMSIGKWHLGQDPCTQGMDFNVGGGTWGHPKSYFAPYKQPDLEAPEGTYLSDHLTREAQEFVRKHRDRPFFLYLPYYAVHTPLQSKPALKQKYLDKGGSACQQNAEYAGMVENLDSCIGSLVRELDRLDLSDNTLVVFTSDNGGIRMVSCQDPLRAGKGSYYEGGIRVPLVFRWPGKIQAGNSTEVPVINLDFYPTLMELIGREAPHALDGLSLWPLLSGEGRLPDRPLYFHFPVYLEAYRKGLDGGRDPLFRTRPGSVIREGNWKLHYYYEDGASELYKLSTDPGETNNLATKYASRTRDLRSKLFQWLQEENAPLEFELNPKFDSLFEQHSAAGPY